MYKKRLTQIRQWRKNNPEKVKQYAKTWLEKHPEQRKASVRAYEHRNRDKISAYHKIYYPKNREHILEQQRERRELKMSIYMVYCSNSSPDKYDG